MDSKVIRARQALSFGLALTALSACGGRTLAIDASENGADSMLDAGAPTDGNTMNADGTVTPSGAINPNGSSNTNGGAGATTGSMVPGTGSAAGPAVGSGAAPSMEGAVVTMSTAPDGSTVTTSISPDGSTVTTTVSPDGAVSVIGSSGAGGAASVGVGMVAPPPIGIGRPGIIMGGFAGSPSSAGGGSEEPLVDCRQTYDYKESGWCENQVECSNGYQWTNCWSNGDSWECQCSASYNSLSLIVSGTVADDVCGYVSDFCATSPQPTGAPKECSYTSQSQGPDYCSLDQQCSTPFEGAEGVDVSTQEYESSWCQTYGSDTICNCYAGNQSLTVTVDAETAPAEKMCGEALAICENGVIDLSGEVACDRSSQSAGGGWCNASLDCKQKAMANGRDLLISGYASTYCTETSPGSWDCYCEGLGTTMNFPLTGDDDWDTCSDAATKCGELITAAPTAE